jgi:hypothetical protein
MICDQCETVAHCTEHGCVPKQPAPVQEPSGFFRHEDVCGDEVGPPTPYYLTPPAAKRLWVGLDNSERLNIWEKAMIEDNGKNASLQNQPFVHFARAIESKLKEKNNG